MKVSTKGRYALRILVDLAINSKVGDDEQTDYFSFVAWRKTAEFCQKYLRKGMKVTVSAQSWNSG